MPIELKMPALSPTMEEGTLAKWLVKAGDIVRSGDVLAEIETDKATMEFEAVDEGVIASITVTEGTDNVKVGTVIAIITAEGEDAGAPAAKSETPEPVATLSKGRPDPSDPNNKGNDGQASPRDVTEAEDHSLPPIGTLGTSDAPAGSVVTPWSAPVSAQGDRSRVNASPLARRIAAEKGVDVAALTGSGPHGRIVKADIDDANLAAAASAVQPRAQAPAERTSAPQAAAAPASGHKPVAIPDIPYEATKLSNMRKTIARRLTESKQTVPHIYLTVDVCLDALLKLRGELNVPLEARGVKMTVNDMLVKALALALIEVPKCNVMFTPDQLISFKRADVSVAVSTPTGLITPVVKDADGKSLSRIATELKELAGRARDGRLKPEEFAGGTASISNMGMYGIKQFDAVINPPQAMILAVGAGDSRPYVIGGQPGVVTMMSATGSFDHRAIDGADAAALMRSFKKLVERPLELTA